MLNYPRDLSGYDGNPPQADWPGGARIAVQFVLNYEEGGENCILHGDPASETFLTRSSAPSRSSARATCRWNRSTNTAARAGVWRLLRPVRVARRAADGVRVAMAAERHPAVIERFLADGHEIASHG